MYVYIFAFELVSCSFCFIIVSGHVFLKCFKLFLFRKQIYREEERQREVCLLLVLEVADIKENAC